MPFVLNCGREWFRKLNAEKRNSAAWRSVTLERLEHREIAVTNAGPLIYGQINVPFCPEPEA